MRSLAGEAAGFEPAEGVIPQTLWLGAFSLAKAFSGQDPTRMTGATAA
jgi:hypothetical protein